MTATRRDERISALLEAAGLEAFGGYWAVLETIAEQMGPGSPRTAVTYSLKEWGRQLGCHRNKAEKLLHTLSSHGLVSIESSGNKVTVNAPNLAKYRDEYSRKSGVTPDTSPSVSHQNQSQIEKQKKEREERGGPGGNDGRFVRGDGNRNRSGFQSLGSTLGQTLDEIGRRARA